MTVSNENFNRMQRLGFASESMNDVIGKMLAIAEPQLLNVMHQKLASSTSTNNSTDSNNKD